MNRFEHIFDRLREHGMFILLAVLVMSAFGFWILSSDTRREIDVLATANSDSAQWSLAQAEVELVRFRNAVLEAQIDGDDADLADVRRRFDVFYSRVSTLATAQVFFDVRQETQVQESLALLDDFLQRCLPVIDGGDANLRAALPRIAEAAEDIQPELRRISIAGVQVFSENSVTQRDRVSNALLDVAILMGILFLVLLVFVTALFLSLRQGRRRLEKVRETQDHIRAVVRTSLDGILVVGPDGRVLDFNGAAEGIFGYTPEEAIGQDMADLIVPDHLRDAHNAGMKRHLETGEKRVVDKGLVQLEAKDKSGRIFPVELSISSARSRRGTIFVSYIRDISDRVAAEKELVDARDKALAGEKAKADLLAVMSHEMRTPLNGLIGSLQILADTSLTNRQRKFVDAMQISSEMLLGHVNTVLDISRVDAGHIQMSRREFVPANVVSSVVESLAVQAQTRGNSLTFENISGRQNVFIGDHSRLGQVMVNLIGNAIKFTENGSITVEMEEMPAEDEVEFRVIDTGIGIAEDDLSKIFADFVTLDASFTREVEGTGLGLGITRRLVAVMGGEIGVESEPGEGSVFWVRLPLPRAHKPTLQLVDSANTPTHSTPKAQIPSSASILLVEDNEINRLVAREMLTEIGCTITEATDGQEGIDIAEVKKFDVILMDISMPKIDGLEATRMIRDGEGPNAKAPIIALTAHALPDDVDRFHAAGMDDVVVKPLSKARIVSVLQDIVPHQKAPDMPAPSEAQTELVNSLGADKARSLTRRALDEISDGLVQLDRMRLSEPDNEVFVALVHRLNGLAGVVGMTELRDQLAKIETRAKSGNLSGIETELATAQNMLDGLQADWQSKAV